MRRFLCLGFAIVGVAGMTFTPGRLHAAEKTAAERGREILLRSPLNPPVWSLKAYENVWKQWGVPAKPADYAQAIQERYGLHPAPYDNHGLPLA
jgi:hypothetical protein